MTEENNIEKLFQDAFENFEVTPPVSVKMEIDKELGPKRRYRFIFWWLPVLILLLTGAAFAVINYNSNSSAAKQVVAASDSNSEPVDSNEPSIKTDSEIRESVTNPEKKSIDPEELVDTKESKSNSDEKNRSSQTGKKQQSVKLKTGSTNSISQNENETTKPLVSAKSKKFLQRKTTIQTKKKTPKKFNKGIGGTLVAVSSNDYKEKGVSGMLDGGSKQNPDSEKTDAADAKEKGGSVETNPVEKDPQGKEKIDSVQKADSLVTAANSVDSVWKPDNPGRVKPPEDNSKARNWMVEIYGGPRFGTKTSKSDFTLKESNAYQIGLGFSRRLNLGPMKYVTLDGEYGSGKESYRSETTTASFIFTGIDSVPVLDSTMTDTLGYTYQNLYDTINTITENNSTSMVTRFAFGLRTQFNFDLGGGFGLAVMPGYYYSMSKFKFSDSSNTSKSTSSQILLGLSAYYDWNRFRFRIGLDTRYELMGKNQNVFIDRRKSFLFSPQFGIAFKF